MVCLGCRLIGPAPMCPDCRARLRSAPERFVAGVGLVRPALVHEAVARLLVHHLKYRGVVAAARVLAVHMAPLVEEAEVLVPVPRVGWRLLRHGVDPAVELAAAVSRLTGRPVERVLRAPISGPARAGRRHGSAPRFRLVGSPPAGAFLLDDVVTTGATLRAGAKLIPGVIGAVTATGSPGQVGSRGD